jgi:hypothetical protein
MYGVTNGYLELEDYMDRVVQTRTVCGLMFATIPPLRAVKLRRLSGRDDSRS